MPITVKDKRVFPGKKTFTEFLDGASYCPFWFSAEEWPGVIFLCSSSTVVVQVRNNAEMLKAEKPSYFFPPDVKFGFQYIPGENIMATFEVEPLF